VRLGDLAPFLRKVENRIGSVGECREKVTEGDHFLATVLKNNVQFVKGEPRDMDAVARK
jgi:hypothetical protein